MAGRRSGDVGQPGLPACPHRLAAGTDPNPAPLHGRGRAAVLGGRTLAVVPAQAGTHNHSRQIGYAYGAPPRRHGVWVPACAGTTAESRPVSDPPFVTYRRRANCVYDL